MNDTTTMVKDEGPGPTEAGEPQKTASSDELYLLKSGWTKRGDGGKQWFDWNHLGSTVRKSVGRAGNPDGRLEEVFQQHFTASGLPLTLVDALACQRERDRTEREAAMRQILTPAKK